MHMLAKLATGDVRLCRPVPAKADQTQEAKASKIKEEPPDTRQNSNNSNNVTCPSLHGNNRTLKPRNRKELPPYPSSQCPSVPAAMHDMLPSG